MSLAAAALTHNVQSKPHQSHQEAGKAPGEGKTGSQGYSSEISQLAHFYQQAAADKRRATGRVMKPMQAVGKGPVLADKVRASVNSIFSDCAKFSG